MTFQYIPPAHSEIDILYIDDNLLIVNKPSGLLSVPGRGDDKQDCLLSRVAVQYDDALIVHRLDMDTSGLMVLARNKDCHRMLSDLFQLRQVSKRYVAMVNGIVTADQGEINLPLITDWPNRPRQKVDPEQGKPSLTCFSVVERNIDEHTTRVELTPVTGRSHQLRVHMQSLGHAILGDRLYASESVRGKSDRLLLHSHFLAFMHPIHHEIISFTVPAPF